MLSPPNNYTRLYFSQKKIILDFIQRVDVLYFVSKKIMRRKLLYIHLFRLKNTYNLLKCSVVNCQIMEPAAVNYRRKLRQLSTEVSSNLFFIFIFLTKILNCHY